MKKNKTFHKYEPKLNLLQVISFKLATRHDFPKGTVFILFSEGGDYIAYPEGRVKSVNSRWIDTAFAHKKIKSVRVYAST